MFHELIYTRCRKGIDILRNQPIATDGFKVYACSNALLEKGACDLPFVQSVMQRKQSYADPTFMDDAYLFYVPDIGNPMLVNFHPVQFDASVKGDFAKRPGNFINDCFTGDFSQTYPFEMFGNTRVWRAEKMNEAYFYETDPAEFPLGIPDDEIYPENIMSDDIRVFLADGRENAFRSALAFLLEQYGQPLEKRKYLLIQDDESRKLELWIAAIESAFSPKISAGLPFATRMADFLRSNRYTVNEDGAFQTQMNLQDPRQSPRQYAMVVGVCTCDKAAANAVRPMPTSPYVLLDGIKKSVAFEVDASHPYFSMVTRLDDLHIDFCRNFLQSFSLRQPCTDVLTLHDVYRICNDTRSAAGNLAKALATLGKFSFDAKSSSFGRLYAKTKEKLAEIATCGPEAFLPAAACLQKIGEQRHDDTLSTQISIAACKMTVDAVFGNASPSQAEKIWSFAMQESFAEEAQREVLDAFRSNRGKIAGFPTQKQEFVYTVVLEAALNSAISPQERQSYIQTVAKDVIDIFISQRNNDSLMELLLHDGHSAGDCRVSDYFRNQILSSAAAEEQKTAEFLLEFLFSHDRATIFTSIAGMDSMCKALQRRKMDAYIPMAMDAYFDGDYSTEKLYRVLDWLKRADYLDLSTEKDCYMKFDSLLNPVDLNQQELACNVQRSKPKGLSCPNSAHLRALSLIGNEKLWGNERINGLEDCAEQGFPGLQERTLDEKYAEQLAKSIVSANLMDTEFECILLRLLDAPPPPLYLRAYLHALLSMKSGFRSRPAHKREQWDMALDILGKQTDIQRRALAQGALMTELSKIKRTPKNIKALSDELQSADGRELFKEAVESLMRTEKKEKSSAFRPNIPSLPNFSNLLFGKGKK